MTATAATRETRSDQIISAFGAAFSVAVGLPAACGRIMAALLLSEHPLSQQDLRSGLGLSEGSVSEGVRLLIHEGLIERVGSPRERPAFFQVRQDPWQACSQHTVDLVHTLRDVAQGSLELLEDPHSAAGARLRQMHRMYDYLARELPQLLEQAVAYSATMD